MTLSIVGTLPTSIGSLTALKIAGLSGNKFRGNDDDYDDEHYEEDYEHDKIVMSMSVIMI